MNPRTLDWLVVDLGGVAADFHPQRRRAALAHDTEMSPDLIHERLFASGLDHDAELGLHTHESITTAVIERLDDRLVVPELIDAWSQAFAPNHDLLDAIGQFPARRTLFTNNGPLLDACLDGPLAQLAGVFDTVICSWHLAVTKPSPQAFARAAIRLASTPSRLCLIDDSQPNIAAAQTARWQTIAHRTLDETLRLMEQLAT